MNSILIQARDAFRAVVEERELTACPVRVTTRALSTEEAIGRPDYDDLPLLRGEEVMIEAEFQGARGHAFTSAPAPWEGSLEALLALPLEGKHQRAVLNAAMNAVLRSLGQLDRTVHCRNEDIERCGEEMAARLRGEFGPVGVGQVGYQPGLVTGLVKHFGPENVRVTDLRRENIGRQVYGVEIWDGADRTEDLVQKSDLVLATGSTAANGTLGALLHLTRAGDVRLILYGVTAAAVCHLCGLRRLCLLSS
jgi:hypothetical protein